MQWEIFQTWSAENTSAISTFIVVSSESGYKAERDILNGFQYQKNNRMEVVLWQEDYYSLITAHIIINSWWWGWLHLYKSEIWSSDMRNKLILPYQTRIDGDKSDLSFKPTSRYTIVKAWVTRPIWFRPIRARLLLVTLSCLCSSIEYRYHSIMIYDDQTIELCFGSKSNGCHWIYSDLNGHLRVRSFLKHLLIGSYIGPAWRLKVV